MTPTPREKVDPVLYLLFVGMVFFTFILIGSEHYFMSDGQMFQVIAGLLAGFSGAFFGRITPTKQTPTPPPPGVTTATFAQTQPEPPKEEAATKP